MSYVGYLPLVKEYIHTKIVRDRFVSLLEIGIDRGTSLIPLVAFLARTRKEFVAVGLDIKVQESVTLMLSNLDLNAADQLVYCIEGNSLSVLPLMIEKGMKFDVVMLDGDHNYHTVSREVALLGDLTHPGSLVICDDYEGRWSERDMWYADRDGYQDVKDATQPVETEKHGVKAAIDEWLLTQHNWLKARPIPSEPIMLMRTA